MLQKCLIIYFLVVPVFSLASEPPEKEFLCLQLSPGIQRTRIVEDLYRPVLVTDFSLMKRIQKENTFHQYGFIASSGIVNGHRIPDTDSVSIYKGVGPVFGFGYQPEKKQFGFDLSGSYLFARRSSDFMSPAFSYTLKVILNASYHGQFFLRFTQTMVQSDEPQFIYQGGFGLQILID